MAYRQGLYYRFSNRESILYQVDGEVQDWGISSGLAMEILQFCTKPLTSYKQITMPIIRTFSKHVRPQLVCLFDVKLSYLQHKTTTVYFYYNTIWKNVNIDIYTAKTKRDIFHILGLSDIMKNEKKIMKNYRNALIGICLVFQFVSPISRIVLPIICTIISCYKQTPICDLMG